ncbi:MAG: hypothetical protein V8S24_03985 [Gordonibacter pamelaeae]
MRRDRDAACSQGAFAVGGAAFFVVYSVQLFFYSVVFSFALLVGLNVERGRHVADVRVVRRVPGGHRGDGRTACGSIAASRSI